MKIHRRGCDYIDTNKELNIKLFLQRENDVVHSPYEDELGFYEHVRAGDIKAITELMDKYPLSDNTGRGLLSEDPVRNVRYHFVISVSMITRFCMEGGMNAQTAYGLSDLYIQSADRCTSIETLVDLHRAMCKDYAGRMKLVRKNKVYSKPVMLCIDYIYEHLQKKIPVSILAAHVGLNESYLSKLFHKETGMVISAFIREKRIEAAQNMLKYSDFSCPNIANYLAFSSQSHFIQVFRKKTGQTPEEYRKRNFRSNWNR